MSKPKSKRKHSAQPLTLEEIQLTVATAWWGGWCAPRAADYVTRLRAGVARHLTLPHRFVLACRERPHGLPCDVETIDLPDLGLMGEMPRLWLLSGDAPIWGRVLLFDLDTVIVGSLDPIAGYSGRLASLEGLWNPSVQSGGVYGYEAGSLGDTVWAPAVADVEETNRLTRGDERKWLPRVAPWADRWQHLFPGAFVSSKPLPARRLRDSVPPGARVVCFHGSPRPHEVEGVPWVKEHWC